MLSRATTEGFDDLYRRHFAAVLAYSTNRVGSSDGPDMAQEVFIVALRRWKTLPTEEPARRAWLLATARRVVANKLRSEDRRRQRESASRQPTEAPDAAHEVTVLDMVDHLLALAGRRSRDDAELLLLLLEERSISEIASVLGVSKPAVATRTHRLRRYMKTVSDEDGHQPDDFSGWERR